MCRDDGFPLIEEVPQPVPESHTDENGPLIEEVPQPDLDVKAPQSECLVAPCFGEGLPVPRGQPVSLGPVPRTSVQGSHGARPPLHGEGAVDAAGTVSELRRKAKAKMLAAKQRLRAQASGACSSTAPPPRPPEFFIAGSWDDWAPHRMTCDEGQRRCHFTLQLGKTGRESFQVWLDADCARCLHPDHADASIHSGFKVCGPDASGHGKNWTVGKHHLDSAAHGVCYDVRLHLDDAGRPTSLDWVRLGVFGQASDQPYWIVGSWDRWAQHRMKWDPGRRCYHTNVLLGSTGRERFQILVHADWGKRLYPPQDNACCHSCRELCGPDGNGHGKNWAIGASALDEASEGLCYEVRLHLKEDGSPSLVDWVKLSAPAADRPLEQAGAAPAQESRGAAPGGAPRLGGEGADAREAMRQYRQRISANLESLSYTELQKDLAARDLEARQLQGQAPPPSYGVPDDTGIGVWIPCCHCGLPVGDFGYVRDHSDDLVHGECYAQIVLQDLRAEEQARLEEEAVLKLAKRREFSIGWAAGQAPSGKDLAANLGASPASQGLLCLVLDEDKHSVRVASTAEPAAAVNLEYLALALQIRLLSGRELMFSLDPLPPKKGHENDCRRWMQKKLFIPDWMAGTSMGEVLFQADYHLKELSMGEYEPPVLGLKSCFDLLAESEGFEEEWNAREWFVIRKAAIHLSEDNVLIPYVQMGVEAREQVRSELGLEDKAFTRPDHPLVRFAEGFSKSFDLIAERKSVIYHLREAAKATVLAKFLMEDRVQLDEEWFSPLEVENAPCLMEIPQLWNERGHSRISVQDGLIMDGDGLLGMRMHGVYGGVDFGLDSLSRPRAQPLRASITARSLERFRPSALAVAQSGLKGVDFDSGMFDLSKPIRTSGLCLTSAGEVAAAGKLFWLSLDDEKVSGADAGFTGLFRAIFNPHLSDRRGEGERFVPPGTSLCYLQKLRDLVREEETLRQRRRDLFFSTEFSEDSPGTLFPASWSSRIALASSGSSRRVSAAPPGSLLQARPDCKAKAGLYGQLLKLATPAFERSTEDGLKFRIYRIGSLEVRTTQAHDGEEELGAFFSFRGRGQPQADPAREQSHRTRDSDWVVKVTLYVERASDVVAGLSTAMPGQQVRPVRFHHYYVVLETEQEHRIVLEKLEDGACVWQEAPTCIDDRCSFAKVLRCADCHIAGVSVGDLKAHHTKAACADRPASEAESRRHAQEAFERAGGPVGTAVPAELPVHGGWSAWSRGGVQAAVGGATPGRAGGGGAATSSQAPTGAESAPEEGAPRPAEDAPGAQRQEWAVVHRQAFLRLEPSFTARLVGRKSEGALLRGVPEEVGGVKWLRVEAPIRLADAGADEPEGHRGQRSAWVLIHGGVIGLGQLLEFRSESPSGDDPGPAPSTRPSRSSLWACPFCDEMNRADRATCNNCSQPRPPPAGAAGRHWLCGTCSEANREERSICNNCGLARPGATCAGRAAPPDAASAAAPPPASPWPAGRPAPFKLFIAGTWGNYSPEEMRWDAGVYAHAVTVGKNRWESFQLLINGSWDATFYPSVADANPFEAWKLCGPDSQGHGRNWQIGKSSVEPVAQGSRFVVLVALSEEGSVSSVHWRLLSG